MCPFRVIPSRKRAAVTCTAWFSVALCWYCTSYRPRSRDKRYRVIRLHRQTLTDQFAKPATRILIQRHHIGRGWPLSAQEWGPVVLEAPETSVNVNCGHLNIAQADLSEHLFERLRRAQRKPHSFIKVPHSRIQFNGGIPEIPHQLHLSSVIPDISRHRASRLCHSRHLRETRDWIWNEVEHET